MRKRSRETGLSERGMVKALGCTLRAASSVARDDRDGLLPLQGV